MIIDMVQEEKPKLIEFQYEEYEYQANISGATVYFNDPKETFTHLVMIKKDNESIKLSLKDALPKAFELGLDYVRYLDSYIDTDVVYTLTSDKVKEDIILKSPAAPLIYTFDLEENQVNNSFLEDGSFEYRDLNNNLIWTIEAPFAYDSNGKEIDVKTSYNGSSYTYELILDGSEVYPLTLDPTITFIYASNAVMASTSSSTAASTSKTIDLALLGYPENQGRKFKSITLTMTYEQYSSYSQVSNSASSNTYTNVQFKTAAGVNVGNTITLSGVNYVLQIPIEAEKAYFTAYAKRASGSTRCSARADITGIEIDDSVNFQGLGKVINKTVNAYASYTSSLLTYAVFNINCVFKKNTIGATIFTCYSFRLPKNLIFVEKTININIYSYETWLSNPILEVYSYNTLGDLISISESPLFPFDYTVPPNCSTISLKLSGISKVSYDFNSTIRSLNYNTDIQQVAGIPYVTSTDIVLDASTFALNNAILIFLTSDFLMDDVTLEWAIDGEPYGTKPITAEIGKVIYIRIIQKPGGLSKSASQLFFFTGIKYIPGYSFLGFYETIILSPDYVEDADLDNGTLVDITKENNNYKLIGSSGNFTVLDDFEGTPKFEYTGDWIKSTVHKQGGNYSYANKDIGANGLSATEFNVTIGSGGGTLSYYLLTQSEANYDFFKCYIDNVLKLTASGATAFVQKSFPLTEGNHTIKLQYTKDSGYDLGRDTVFVDNLEVTNVFMSSMASTGTIISAPINISSFSGEVYFTYDAIIPEGTSITIDYSIDGGSIWSPVPFEPTKIQEINDSSSMLLRATLNGDGISLTPLLKFISIFHKSSLQSAFESIILNMNIIDSGSELLAINENTQIQEDNNLALNEYIYMNDFNTLPILDNVQILDNISLSLESNIQEQEYINFPLNTNIYIQENNNLNLIESIIDIGIDILNIKESIIETGSDILSINEYIVNTNSDTLNINESIIDSLGETFSLIETINAYDYSSLALNTNVKILESNELALLELIVVNDIQTLPLVENALINEYRELLISENINTSDYNSISLLELISSSEYKNINIKELISYEPQKNGIELFDRVVLPETAAFELNENIIVINNKILQILERVVIESGNKNTQNYVNIIEKAMMPNIALIETILTEPDQTIRLTPKHAVRMKGRRYS